ncbi:MAG: hypothetical protein KDJ99_01015 [Candidatus Competibacteraceae bacterium]|nr:hypothetical protein [Candidatus Competibacteraceae bacterium]
MMPATRTNTLSTQLHQLTDTALNTGQPYQQVIDALLAAAIAVAEDQYQVALSTPERETLRRALADTLQHQIGPNYTGKRRGGRNPYSLGDSDRTGGRTRNTAK